MKNESSDEMNSSKTSKECTCGAPRLKAEVRLDSSGDSGEEGRICGERRF